MSAGKEKLLKSRINRTVKSLLDGVSDSMKCERVEKKGDLKCGAQFVKESEGQKKLLPVAEYT